MKFDQHSGKEFIRNFTFFFFFFKETRRSSENDSQSCDVPGFLKLGWSFKQLPKVRDLVPFGNG